MKEKIKIVFIGGLTNGKIVYDYLSKNRHVNLALTITYPDYIEKPRFVPFPDDSNIIKSERANDHFDLIKKINPDMIVVAGWSELLNDDLIKIPSLGTIGFHPAKLPKDRGRSVLAWQIEEGYTETALTMFYYTDIPDGGDIIAQETIKIAYNDYINDVLDKVDNATYNIMRAYFPLLRQGKAPRIPQNHNLATFRRLRNENDSLINWNKNSLEIYNKIRAISQPYPGAHFIHHQVPVKVFQANLLNDNYWKTFYFYKSGTVIARFLDNSVVVKTKDGVIQIFPETDINPGELL